MSEITRAEIDRLGQEILKLERVEALILGEIGPRERYLDESDQLLDWRPLERVEDALLLLKKMTDNGVIEYWRISSSCDRTEVCTYRCRMIDGMSQYPLGVATICGSCTTARLCTAIIEAVRETMLHAR